MMNATTLRIGQRLKVKLNAGVVEAVYQGAHPANEDYGLFNMKERIFLALFLALRISIQISNPMAINFRRCK
jgi:hypothetical protein